jgi:hypothetical protein
MFKLTRRGGEEAKRGNYWNFSTGERVRLEEETILPGDSSAIYVKCHPVALLLVGPFMGLAYAIFLPLVGIGMLLWVLGEKIAGRMVQSLWKTAVFSWHPSEAYLAGKKRRTRKREEDKKQ